MWLLGTERCPASVKKFSGSFKELTSCPAMPKRSAEFPFSRPLWEKGFSVKERDFPELGAPAITTTSNSGRKNVEGTKYSAGVFPGQPSQLQRETVIVEDVGKGCSRWKEERNLVQKVPQIASETEFPELNPLSPEQKEKKLQEAVRKWIGTTPVIGKGEGWMEGKPDGLLGSGDGYTWMSNETRSQLQELYSEQEDEEGNEVLSLPTKPCWWYTMGEPGGFDPKTGKSGAQSHRT